MADPRMTQFLAEGQKMMVKKEEMTKKIKEAEEKYGQLNHFIIDYDIGSNGPARADIEEFLNESNKAELSESCYLVRSLLDRYQILARLTKHVRKTHDRFSVSSLDVYKSDKITLACPLAPFGDKVLAELRSRGYLYLVDPKYWPVG